MRFETTALYRHFDIDGNLLYVGISTDPLRRFEDHLKDKPWATEVASISVQWFHRTRWWAALCERAAIRWENPRYNKQSVVKHTDNFAHYLALRNLNQADDYHAMLAILIAQNFENCKADGFSIFDEAHYEFATFEALCELAIEIEDEFLTHCENCTKLMNSSWLSEGREVYVDFVYQTWRQAAKKGEK